MGRRTLDSESSSAVLALKPIGYRWIFLNGFLGLGPTDEEQLKNPQSFKFSFLVKIIIWGY